MSLTIFAFDLGECFAENVGSPILRKRLRKEGRD